MWTNCTKKSPSIISFDNLIVMLYYVIATGQESNIR